MILSGAQEHTPQRKMTLTGVRAACNVVQQNSKSLQQSLTQPQPCSWLHFCLWEFNALTAFLHAIWIPIKSSEVLTSCAQNVFQWPSYRASSIQDPFLQSWIRPFHSVDSHLSFFCHGNLKPMPKPSPSSPRLTLPAWKPPLKALRLQGSFKQTFLQVGRLINCIR